MKNLETSYSAEVDNITKIEWFNILKRFDDANIYQTWSYGAVHWGEHNLSHLILKKNGEIVAATQLRILKVPVFKGGIAYIRWGPVWQLLQKEMNLENLRQMARALVNEYVVRRGLFLRVIPNKFKGNPEADTIRSILESEGLVLNSKSICYRTFLLDISPPPEEIRRRFKKRWRNRLKRAEKNGLKVAEGSDDALFETFSALYKEMLARKRFASFVDVDEFREIQKNLPSFFKMTILICEMDGEPVSGAVFSAIGKTGLCLLSATNMKGRELQSSYLLKWKTIERVKERGYNYLDLGGIDPKRTPEVDQFKAGMSGRDSFSLGVFEACQSHVSSSSLILADLLKAASHRIKLTLERKKNTN
ncbi:MAG: lipid II:glycine glycyltransferase FemX [Candidatus Hodarchaeota archaeon]